MLKSFKDLLSDRRSEKPDRFPRRGNAPSRSFYPFSDGVTCKRSARTATSPGGEQGAAGSSRGIVMAKHRGVVVVGRL